MLKLRIISLLILMLYDKTMAWDISLLSPYSGYYDLKGDTLLDIKDYDDKGFISTRYELFESATNFYGIKDPEWNSAFNIQKTDGSSQDISLPKNTVFASFGDSYMFAGCNGTYLITYFSTMTEIDGGLVKGLYKESGISLTGEEICSISYLDYFVFLVHSNKNNNNLNFYRIRIENTKNSYGQPSIDEDFSPNKIKFVYTPDFTVIEDFRYYSCEAFSPTDGDDVLVCGFVYKNTANNKYKYVARAVNYAFNGLDGETTILESENLLYFKIQKINTYYARYLVENNSFEIYITNSANVYTVHVVSEDSRNKNLYSYYSYGDLFYYNNDYIFHAIPTDNTLSAFKLYISNDKGSNIYLTTIDKHIQKIQGIHIRKDDDNDKFIYVFQYEGEIYYLIASSSEFEPTETVCEKAWYLDDDGTKVCLDNDYCQSNEYLYHTDTKECKKDECNSDYYKFNFECYKDECPENTQINSDDSKICESTLNYCYISTPDFKTICSIVAYDSYSLKYKNTKIFLSNCDDSSTLFNSVTYLFNKECLDGCPENTILNNENKKCECKFKYYIDDDEKLNCLENGKKCEDTDYIIESNTNQCFKSKQSCIDNNNKFFNNKCYINSCPENTNDNSGTCECSYLYYLDSNIYTCLGNTDTCTFKISNECFHSLNDCINKDKKTFNNRCYDSCPTNTEEDTNDESKKGICQCKYNYYFFSEDNTYTCLGNGETCGEKEYNYQSLDGIICYKNKEECISAGKKVFNNICYDNSCPADSNSDDNDNDGICKCTFNYYYNTATKKYTCLENGANCESKGYTYKSLDGTQCYSNSGECSGKKIFNNICYDSCPLNSQEKEIDDGSKICECSYAYYVNSGIYTCFESGDTCESKGYTYKAPDGKQCYSNSEECSGKIIFNNICYDSCPTNTAEKDNVDGRKICECSYLYYLDSGIYTCLGNTDSCTFQIANECFHSINDCANKGKKIFNNQCYTSCPSNTQLNTDDKKCYCKYSYHYNMFRKW